MIKYLVLLFNVMGILFFKTFFETEPITVAHNFPESVVTGGEYVVEVKINKNTVGGFAELKQILPIGFNASIIDSKQGSFSFSDREVKIIWMTLPDDAEFTVKYKITVLAEASGQNQVVGTFSYLDNNQKATVNLETKPVLLATGSAPTENLVVAASAPVSNLPVFCERTISSVNPGDAKLLVSVKIKNDSISGFAKLEELIPEGYVASSDEVHNAVFSFVDQKVKFLWMSFPFEKEFTVSYFLVPQAESNDTLELNGYLSFTIAEETKKFTLASSSFLRAKNESISAKEITTAATVTTTDTENKVLIEQPETSTVAETNTSNTVATEKVTTPASLAEAALQNNEQSKSNSPLGKASEESTTTKSSSGVEYRVQICATRKPVEIAYLQSSYKLTENLYAEMHEGWHKFTVNTVSEYKAARDKREELRQNEAIKGPFVTAYNAGTRISVQEALMIANQKWVR